MPHMENSFELSRKQTVDGGLFVAVKEVMTSQYSPSTKLVG